MFKTVCCSSAFLALMLNFSTVSAQNFRNNVSKNPGSTHTPTLAPPQSVAPKYEAPPLQPKPEEPQRLAAQPTAQKEKQYILKFKIFEGDPDSSVEEGGVKLLANPTIAVAANRLFRFNSGGEIPWMKVIANDKPKLSDYAHFGTELDGAVYEQSEFEVNLFMKVTLATLDKSSPDNIEVSSKGKQIYIKTKLASPAKFNFEKNPVSERQTWGEVVIYETNSQNLSQGPSLKKGNR